MSKNYRLVKNPWTGQKGFLQLNREHLAQKHDFHIKKD